MGCREIDSSKQEQIWLMGVKSAPSPEVFVLFKEVLVIQVYKNIKLTRNKNRIQKAFSISQIWYKTV